MNVGILSPPEKTEDAWLYDAPRHWAEQSFQIPRIVEYRASLVNSHSRSHVKSGGRLLEISREVGMASKPVEIEMLLKGKPVMRMSADSVSAPLGPSAQVRKARVTSNPKIPAKAEKVFSDAGMKASDAVDYLYGSGFDENFLSRMLSVGTVGVGNGRRLVPTRWSITATDDMIGKRLAASVKDFGWCADYLLYFGGYLGNYFIVMLFPDAWGYELFESLEGHGSFTTDFEGHAGRSGYASETAGGYYAARLAVLEKLSRMKRQASALALRIITAEYTVPLGVWVVRQAARKALSSRPVSFSSREAMLGHAAALAAEKFGHRIQPMLERSALLRGMKSQQKLAAFL